MKLAAKWIALEARIDRLERALGAATNQLTVATPEPVEAPKKSRGKKRRRAK